MENGNKWTNAIYFNPAKFILTAKHEAKYKDESTGKDQGQGFVKAQLQCKQTEISFNVYTTHLKAKKGFEEMRRTQVKQLVDNALTCEHPAILCGDWNDTPDSAALKVVKGTDSIKMATGNQEPEFTTHKYRPTTGMQTRTIDHFYYFERMPAG